MSRRDSSAFGTVMSVLAVVASLVVFCLFFTAFLLVPFFIFIAGGIALLITERNSKTRPPAPPALPPKPQVRADRSLPQRTGGPR